MEDNTMTNDFLELEDMRRQISLLKKKLDKESIVNDKLMRDVMNIKVDKINRYLYKMLVILPPAMILCCIAFTTIIPLSTAFIIASEFFLLFCCVYIYLNKRLLASTNITDGNLVEESKKLLHFKKRQTIYYYINLLITVLWAVWFFYELLNCGKHQDTMISMIIGSSIGCISGFIFDFKKFRRMIRNINEVLSQIEDVCSHD